MWTRFLVMSFWTRVAIAAGIDAMIDGVRLFSSWLGGYHLASAPQLIDHNLFHTIISQGIGYVLAGLMVAAFTNNSHEIYTYTLRGLDSQQRSTAIEAAIRGPVPTDVYVRSAAIGVARRRLQCVGFWKTIWLVALCLNALALALGLTDGWQGFDLEGWAWSVLVPCFAAAAWYVSKSAEQRFRLLSWTDSFDAAAVSASH